MRDDLAPHAQIWVPTWAHHKMFFMYQPAVQTIQEGLRAANISARVLTKQNQFGNLKHLRPGDVWIWVGAGSNDVMLSHLQNNITNGVLTIYYSTEADFGVPCVMKLAFPVHEVWEYSMRNVLCCKPISRRPWRFVPPGYIRRPVMAGTQEAGANRSVWFLGSTASYYDKRRACLRSIAQQLTLGAAGLPARGQLPRESSACVHGFCAGANCAALGCSLRLRNTAYDEASFDRQLQAGETYFSVHKHCNLTAVSSFMACESFRFAPLLSAGALVFSEHCHPEDERAYEGLVQFATISELGWQVDGEWRRPQSTAPQRAAIFAQRFAPASIFERAGIIEALAAHTQKYLSAPAKTTVATMAAPRLGYDPTRRAPPYCGKGNMGF